MTDREILIGSHAWSATPWDYSSLRWLHFRADGTAEFTYGYGQSIYAVVPCRYELPPAGVLHVAYLDPPPSQRVGRVVPTDANRSKAVGYKLTAGEFRGVESVVGWPFVCRWMLELSGSPYPEGLWFPYEVPLVYYGYREEQGRRP